MKQVSGIPGFNTRIVFGGINLSMVVGLAAQDTGEQVLQELGMDKIRLKAPVHHGDTLYTITEVLEKRDSDRADAGIVKFKLIGRNSKGLPVVEIERTVLIKRRSHFRES